MVHLNFKLVLYELFKQKYVNFLHLSKNDNSSLFPFSAHSKYLSTYGFFVSSGPVLLLILIILTDLIKEILPCYNGCMFIQPGTHHIYLLWHCWYLYLTKIVYIHNKTLNWCIFMRIYLQNYSIKNSKLLHCVNLYLYFVPNRLI